MIARAASFDALEVAEATQGDLSGETRRRFVGVSTDTRDELVGRLFVALVGERHDAHAFLRDALDAGAAGLLVERRRWASAGGGTQLAARSDVAIIQVEDTLQGLGDLARHHRRKCGVPVVALTGSNGKTSTKEVLRSVFRTERETVATRGNLNNLIGLPLTLLDIDPVLHKVCVAEMGMNAPGEIARMVAIAEPDVAMVLNVGPAHIGELGSIEAIAKAKGEMFHHAPGHARLVANRDDPRVMGQVPEGRIVRTFGASAGADVRLLEVEPEDGFQRIKLEVDDSPIETQLSLLGQHNALNAAAAVAAATATTELRPSLKSLRDGVAAVEPVGGRLSVRTVGPWTVIDDAYNANVGSARAAIETARSIAQGRRWVAVFGEMKELGTFSDSGHREVGGLLAEAGAQVIVSFGPDARALTEQASNRARVHHEDHDFDLLFDWLRAQLEPGDILLVKGSRASRMERVVTRLEDEL